MSWFCSFCCVVFGLLFVFLTKLLPVVVTDDAVAAVPVAAVVVMASVAEATCVSVRVCVHLHFMM